MFLLKEILDPLKLEESKELLTIVGAGGKTTCIFTLAKELKSLGKRVLITTTTAIYKPLPDEYDRLYIGEKQDILQDRSKNHPPENAGEIVVWGRKTDQQGKIRGVCPGDIDEIWESEKFSWILVEGDGAKRKSIKAPKENEPVIPSNTTMLIGVIGMEVLGKPIQESYVHRVDYFTEITGTKKEDIIDEAVLERLILQEEGIFKKKPKGAKKILLLNQCEDKEIRNRAIILANSLSMSYLVTSLQQGKVYECRRYNDTSR